MVKLSKAICSHLWQVETTMHYILAFGGSIETLGLCCRCFRSRRLSCFTDPEKFLSKAKKDVNIKRDAVCGIYREKTVNGIIGLWGHHSSQASFPNLEIARFHMARVHVSWWENVTLRATYSDSSSLLMDLPGVWVVIITPENARPCLSTDGGQINAASEQRHFPDIGCPVEPHQQTSTLINPLLLSAECVLIISIAQDLSRWCN